jgi:AcrR family transcriptional regulator
VSTARTTGARTPRGAARENILRAALELFYAGGVQAVGVDAIAKRSGVAKVTLYRHFATKAELVSAVLEAADAAYLSAYRAAMEAGGDNPRERVCALFDALDELAQGPAFRGCIFINSGLALGDAQHPAHERVRRHKDALRDLLAGELGAAGHSDPDGGAEQLLLLVDGALVAGALRPDRHPARAARRLARKVFD